MAEMNTTSGFVRDWIMCYIRERVETVLISYYAASPEQVRGSTISYRSDAEVAILLR